MKFIKNNIKKEVYKMMLAKKEGQDKGVKQKNLKSTVSPLLILHREYHKYTYIYTHITVYACTYIHIYIYYIRIYKCIHIYIYSCPYESLATANRTLSMHFINKYVCTSVDHPAFAVRQHMLFYIA